MTKTYCTACACYKKRIPTNTRKRECLHSKGPGKLESPRTPETCPLEIKYRFTYDNSKTLQFVAPASTILGMKGNHLDVFW